MKAKHLREHLKEPEIEETEDKWGDQVWVVEGVTYRFRYQATAAVARLIETEFRSRYLKEKK